MAKDRDSVEKETKEKTSESTLKKEERKEAQPKKSKVDVAAKIERIQKSKLSDADKEQMIQKLKIKDAKPEVKVRFGAFANRLGLTPRMRTAMLAYPKAKGVVSATIAQWDEIFKDF